MTVVRNFGQVAAQPAARAAMADAPQGSPRVAALVVTHNRLDQLSRTVKRLLEEPVDHLIVVNNASTDGTGTWLAAEQDPRLHVITAPRNVGGAGGFELGLAAVKDTIDPDWCVLMDDDARPRPGAIRAFRARAAKIESDGYDAIAGGVFYPDGRICDMNRPSRNPFWHASDFLRTLLRGGGRGGFHVPDSAYWVPPGADAHPIDVTSFVGFFLSRNGLRRGGLPDGGLFIYGDDVIYTMQLTKRGGRIGFLPEIGFEHDCSTYHAHSGDICRPTWKVYYIYRNSLKAYRIAAGPVLFWPVLVLAAAKWRLRARNAGPSRSVYLLMYRLALKDALAGRCDRPHAEIVNRAAELI